jgi:gluconolactonase
MGGRAGSAGADEDAGLEVDAGVHEDPCANADSSGDPLPAEGQRTAMLVQGGFDFVEGPLWVASQQVLLFSDMHMGQAMGSWPPATIRRYTPGQGFDVFVDASGSNGLALTRDGDVLACTHDTQTLSIFDIDSGARTTLPLTYMGDHFNSPNDVTVRSDGTIYFTDPDWQLGGRANETGMTGVYRVAPGGTPELVEGTLDKPNGIALSPDERVLYVGSSGNDVMRYDVADDGSTSGGRVFASPGGSDGMTVDCAGNLYVTAGSVRVFDPEGNELGTITTAESPTNVAFGGSERKTLFVTAQSGVYAIEMNVAGKPY